MTYEEVLQIKNTTNEDDTLLKTRQKKFGITFLQAELNLGLLYDLLNKHIGIFNIEMMGKKAKYWLHVNEPKKYKSHCNTWNYISITGKGTYFNKREAITFCDSGYIGFCCEADSKNEMPVLRAFGEWLEMIKGDKV